MILNQDLINILRLKLPCEIQEAIELIRFVEDRESIQLSDYQKFFLQKKLLTAKNHLKKNLKSCGEK